MSCQDLMTCKSKLFSVTCKLQLFSIEMDAGIKIIKHRTINSPPKCQFFMWLVVHNKCWTADRLACRGLPRLECCPLCDQDDETINHLLVGCIFAREFWFLLLRQVGLQALSPQPSENSFLDW